MPKSSLQDQKFSLTSKRNHKAPKSNESVIKEGVASNILDNIPQEKTKERFARCFNITGYRPTLERWKHKEASKLNFKDLIERLKPSKLLLS